MKRFLLAIVLCFGATVGAFAQMTDSQVADFVKKEHQAGSSQTQITTKLMERGVTADQIRRLRDQYSSQMKNSGKTASSDSLSVRNLRNNRTNQILSEEMTDRYGAEDDSLMFAEKKESKVYGHDVFNHRIAVNANLPVPQGYVLGAGDEIVIDIYGASQKTLVYLVSAEGTVTVEGVGPVQIGGLSVEAAQVKLKNTVGAHYSTSDVRLTVANTRSIMVQVMGEVRSPGSYNLSAYATVFHALYMAGGIKELGTLRNIKVFRNGKQVTVVDIYEYLINGKLVGNIKLQDNDVIIVGPYESWVEITGKVKRPMFYEMRKNESVGTLLGYAGGFTGDAYKKSVRLVRKTGDFYTVHNVDEFDMNTFIVEDGDSLSVDSVLDRYENTVEVRGAVFRPGQFNLNSNVYSVRTLVQAASGLMEDAFTQHGLIYRYKDDRSLEVVPVDVRAIMNETTADVMLKNEDILFIPRLDELREERWFHISGEVIAPGTYEFADNTTIEDLIVMAGGLRDGASLSRVDVSRRINNPYSTMKGHEISETYKFDIQEGMVIDEGRTFVLQPYDVVHIRRSPGYVMPQNITITGEVNYEGTFTLEKKNLRLTDAIEMAGGIATDAYVKGARLLRTMNAAERARKQATLDALKNMTTDEDSVAMNKLQLTDTYAIGIDLEKALQEPGGQYDLVLREGDHLDIPEYNGTVKISGDVQFPNTITYVKGKKAKWFVENAGGYSEQAKKKKAFIVYQNGMMARLTRSVEVEPGSEIVVPSKKQKHFWSLSDWIAAGTSVASLATMMTSIAYLTK